MKHINPNCLDSRFCEPHGETGEVTHKKQIFVDSVLSKNQAIIAQIGFVCYGLNVFISEEQ